MDNKWIKRLVSLTVALEMLCSPVAMAEEAVAERPEVPAAVEQGRAETPAPSPADSPAAPSADSSAGLFALPVDDFNLAVDMSFGVPLTQGAGSEYPARYDGYLTHEGGSGGTWGYRIYESSKEKYFNLQDGNYYAVLPDPGRMPDLELDGFYVLGEPTENSWLDSDDRAGLVKQWVYDETWTDPVRLKETDEPVIFNYQDDWDYDRGDYLTLAYLTEEEMESLFTDDIARDDGYMGFVPIVARWKDSSNRNLTRLRLTTYTQETGAPTEIAQLLTQDPTGIANPETMNLADINATYFDDPDAPREFWLRVPEDQETLTLNFEAYEPYYDYNVTQDGEGECPVSVSVLFNNRPVTVDDQAIQVRRGWTWDESGAPTDAISPAPKYDASSWPMPQNTAANPARSRWTVSNIPLAKVADAEDVNNGRTVITITITAPDGQKSDYTLRVGRYMTPTYTLGLGNTPLAMIEKDVSGNWGVGEEEIRAGKDAAKADFKDYNRLGNDGEAAPGDYSYYRGKFFNDAWRYQTWNGQRDYNIDLDETAVVAYQDTAFADPGVTFIGSNGRPVPFGADAPAGNQTCVTRTIQLRVADVLTADLYSSSDGATTCWYNPAVTDAADRLTTDSKQSAQVLQNADGSDGVDLRGLNVLPGVYTMTYTYTDPMATEEPVVAQRPLVVLPIPGDVDMDGAVTVADALTLSAHQAEWGRSTAPGVQLLLYRVLRRVVNGQDSAVDAAAILAGFQPEVIDPEGGSDYFYPPLPVPADASDTYQRRTWDQVKMDGSARLELRYLGVEQGMLQGEGLHTVPSNGKIGPWQADKEEKVTVRETNIATGGKKYAAAGQNDVFWVGVYLTAGELAGRTVEDLALTLTYDSDLVQPATVYQYNQFRDFTGEDRWKSTVFYYNFDDGSEADGVPQTLFSGYAIKDYTFRDGTTWGRPYATHYSKVIGELEQVQNAGSLREMVFNVQGTSTGRRVTLPKEETCVLVVPFQLVKHPVNSRLEEGEARLVELGAGMRDFTLVTGSGASGVSAASAFGWLLSSYGQSAINALDAGDVTYAFSAQDDIYGGATHNLRDTVNYQDETGAISGMIPIGENKTSTSGLPTATYAVPYTARIDPGGELTGKLPEGLSAEIQSTGEILITGTPLEAGTFPFTVTAGGSEYPYELVVKKLQLHFFANGYNSYYGQTECRGVSSKDFTFSYRTADLAELDKEGKTLTGDGAELVDILGPDYVPPTFTAKLSRDTTDAENPVVLNTPVGDYPIVLDDRTALDNNYDLILDEEQMNAQLLHIDPRPVWIDHITATAEDTGAWIYSDSTDLTYNNITIDESALGKEAIHLTLHEEASQHDRPLTGDARVSGDKLKLHFNGEFLRNEDDLKMYPDDPDTFYMTADEVIRSIGKITISDRDRLAFNEENPNYQLQLSADGTVSHSELNDVQGRVVRRVVTKLEFSGYPNALNGTGAVSYGESITLRDLRIRIHRADQQIGDSPYDQIDYAYDGTMSRAMNIHYNWVTPEERAQGLASPNTVVGSGWDPTKPEGQQDARPYAETNSFLGVDLDGYYLCAIVRKYAESDPDAAKDANAYVKVYSDYPIRVSPREITLTLDDMDRFYGEEAPQPSYTYDVNALAEGDLNKLKAQFGDRLTGQPYELEWLLGEDYTKPTVQFMRAPRLPTSSADPDLVTVATDASSTDYYQVISGAQASNYTFRYARVGGERPQAGFGTAYLHIMRRPIVVADVGSMYAASADGRAVPATEPDSRETFAVLYADSKELLLADQVDNGAHTPFAASAAADAVNRVTFIAPAYDPLTQTVSYYNGGASDDFTSRPGMAYSTAQPVLPDDMSQLSVTYKVQFLPDDDGAHTTWNSFTTNYFDTEDLTASGGQAQRPVELRDLELTGAKAGNYVLVYNDSSQANRRAPANSQLVTAPNPSSNIAEQGRAAFQQYGTGLVVLRPIHTMEIQALGRMEYTYGEYFAPDSAGPTGDRFTLSVNYDTRYDNYPAQYEGDQTHNIGSELLEYIFGSGDSSFKQRGFAIHYIDLATQQPQDLAEDGQVVMGRDPLYPIVHDGKYLFVTGRRGENSPLVYSDLSDIPLAVARTPLVLTARDLHRFYGEENQRGYVVPLEQENEEDTESGTLALTFTFQASQLARWDRDMLAQLLDRTIREVDTLTQLDLERALALAGEGTAEQREWAANFGYQKPAIATDATKTSPINTEHGWGEYPITNAATDFAGYQVEGVGATLFVYPRPIRVVGVVSSREFPVYTIYNQTGGAIFNTIFEQDRVQTERANSGLTPTWTQDLADGVHRNVYLYLSGDPLVGDDVLEYRAVVDYADADTTLPDGVTDAYMSVVTTILGLSATKAGAERNYALDIRQDGTAYVDPASIAAVKLRTIGYVLIRELPRQEYSYGEALDLSGLRVSVYYELDEGVDQYARENVSYIDADQFQSYGLHVNYWDPSLDVVPDSSQWKTIPTSYRQASTGDHLTIAPTHDTQRFLGRDGSDPLERPFAANGMGLIVSAFQEGENQPPAQPKVLAASPLMIPGVGAESYELTGDNAVPFTITVHPRQLQYTLSATDKTYNGDRRTAGTLQLTNLFDQKNVQVKITSPTTADAHTPVYEDVTDVVYVPVGAAYETLGDDCGSYGGSAYRVTDGAVSFTTGTYADDRASLLSQNPAVRWSDGYQWGRGLLEFTFPNANVHYVDDAFVDGAAPGVGTEELALYWRAAQDMNDVSARWDSYPAVSQMPVEVSNMTFLGPDAANYTWGPETEPRLSETQLTLDADPDGLGPGQAGLPYATIRKANRQPIQDLLSGQGFALPTLQVDDRTNVVRMTYQEDLARIADLTGAAAGERLLSDDGADQFRDELHFEYALAYAASDGLLRRWAGREGDGAYQDTVFFGGEAVAPEVDPAYTPDLSRLDKAENANENTVYKGQRYRWADEDTGLSQRGWREDGGFALSPASYPGYAAYGADARSAYWYYDLYATDRAPLPRNTVFYPLVRLAETHNYNPSGDLTADGDGDGRPDVSAWTLYEALQAVDVYSQDQTQDQTLLDQAQDKSAAALDDCRAMRDLANAQSAQRVADEAARAEEGFPEEPPQQPGPTAAVKSYHQRFDLLSASWERQDSEEYLVQLLEDVRFTDTLSYPEQKLLDSVVYNSPTRYYGYFWDPDKSASIRFGDQDAPIDFDTVMEAEVRRRQSGGATEETLFVYDPVASNHTAQLYISANGSSGRTVRSIRIVPSALFVRVGDPPVRLSVVTDPKMPTNRRYTWTSSDPSVVSVDETGLVTIRGEGVAVITVTTTNRRHDSITVVVSPSLPFDPGSAPIFNYYFTGAWAQLDETGAFRPYDAMTRGEMVQLLELFLNPDHPISEDREVAYVDVTGREKYYSALVRLTKVGAVQGLPGATFAGERLATRAEFVTILARMLERDVPDTIGMAHAFADSGEDSTWAYAYIDAMAKAGVIKGVGGGSFVPNRPITREETAAILARLVISRMDAADPSALHTPSDMTPENWSYPAVLRAVNSVVGSGY